MQKSIPITTLFTALALAACGGGNSGDQTTPEKTESVKPEPTVPETVQTDPALKAFAQKHLANGKTLPASVKREKTGTNAGYLENTDNSVAALNAVTVDGTQYAVAKKDDNKERYNYVGGSSHNAVSSGSFLSYSRFAVLNIADYYNDSFLAYGQYTQKAEMPKSGNVKYSGHGLHRQNGRTDLIATDVDARVDFAAGTASVGITADGIKPIMLNGTVTGNTVKGKNELRAGFYGPDAQELTGSYVKDGNGVFGATKE